MPNHQPTITYQLLSTYIPIFLMVRIPRIPQTNHQPTGVDRSHCQKLQNAHVTWHHLDAFPILDRPSVAGLLQHRLDPQSPNAGKLSDNNPAQNREKSPGFWPVTYQSLTNQSFPPGMFHGKKSTQNPPFAQGIFQHLSASFSSSLPKNPSQTGHFRKIFVMARWVERRLRRTFAPKKPKGLSRSRCLSWAHQSWWWFLVKLGDDDDDFFPDGKMNLEWNIWFKKRWQPHKPTSWCCFFVRAWFFGVLVLQHRCHRCWTLQKISPTSASNTLFGLMAPKNFQFPGARLSRSCRASRFGRCFLFVSKFLPSAFPTALICFCTRIRR